MSQKSRLLPALAFSFAAALGVYLGHVGKAHAEKCDPKNPGICVGGPTGGDPTCGVLGKPCCPDPEGKANGAYCTDEDLRCVPSSNNPQQFVCDY